MLWLALIPEILTWVGQRANQFINLAPGKIERSYRDMVKGDVARLEAGGGGLTGGQVSAMQAQGQGQIRAQVDSTLADLARNTNTDAGAGGLQAAQAGAVRQAGITGTNQLSGDIRNADIAAADAARERMLTAIALSNQRKIIARDTPTGTRATGGNPLSAENAQAFAGGQGTRSTTGAGLDSAVSSALSDAGGGANLAGF